MSWYKRNREHSDAMHREYVEKNRLALNAKIREKWKNDPVYRERRKRYAKKHRENNKATIYAKQAAWRRKNPHRVRLYEIKRLYGLTPQEYADTLQRQDNSCAICRERIGVKPRDSHIDHCHESGKIRGILCNKCNLIVGWWEGFTRNPDFRDKIISYLGKIDG